MSPIRFLMVLVGFAIFLLYSIVAVAGFLLMQWLFENPPDPLLVLAMFLLTAFVGAYIGFKQGTVQVVASVDALTVTKPRAPELHRRLERLSMTMNVAQPVLLVADLDAPNALSVGGPREGAIIIDHRLLDMLTIDEMEGILAHELAHIERYDTFLNTLAITIARLFVSTVIVLLLPVVIFLAGVDRATAWIAGRPGSRFVGLSALFQRGVAVTVGVLLGVFAVLFLVHSRRQEFAADRRAAEVSGHPIPLARALVKIHHETEGRRQLRSILYTHEQDQTERPRWLSTHPPIDDRVDRLVELAEREPTRHQLRRIRPNEKH